MSDPWLLVALITTPVTLVIIVIVLNSNRPRKLIEKFGDWINQVFLTPINSHFIKPLEKRAEERRTRQHEKELAEWHARQTEEELRKRGS